MLGKITAQARNGSIQRSSKERRVQQLSISPCRMAQCSRRYTPLVLGLPRSPYYISIELNRGNMRSPDLLWVPANRTQVAEPSIVPWAPHSRWSVPGCIDAGIIDKRLICKGSPRSTNLASFSTSRISHFELNVDVNKFESLAAKTRMTTLPKSRIGVPGLTDRVR